MEALHAATLNIHPTKTLNFHTPHHALFCSPPSYSHLHVSGCRCYPNLSATAPHKLAPRSSVCVFLGYPDHHKGYRCLDLSTNRIIISRHVTFDKNSFPFAERVAPPIPSDFNFLDEIITTTPALVLSPISPPIPVPATLAPPPPPPPTAQPIDPVVNNHSMTTRDKHGFR